MYVLDCMEWMCHTAAPTTQMDRHDNVCETWRFVVVVIVCIVDVCVCMSSVEFSTHNAHKTLLGKHQAIGGVGLNNCNEVNYYILGLRLLDNVRLRFGFGSYSLVVVVEVRLSFQGINVKGHFHCRVRAMIGTF